VIACAVAVSAACASLIVSAFFAFSFWRSSVASAIFSSSSDTSLEVSVMSSASFAICAESWSMEA